MRMSADCIKQYISERLLDHAVRNLSMDAAFARVGQIAGAVKYAGLWNPTEWFPSLVLSSIHIGAVPESLGPTFDQVDWVPVDFLAEILVELAFSQSLHSEPSPPTGDAADFDAPFRSVRVFHPLNPSPTTWEAVRAIVTHEVSSLLGKPLDVIPMEAWIRKVRADMESMANSANYFQDSVLKALLRANPAVKLLDFYEQVLGTKEGPQNQLAMDQTTRTSAKLRAVEGVKADWVRKWVGEWVAWTQRVVPAVERHI